MHISRLDVKRTEKVTDVVNVGDEVMVKVLEIDDKGRLNLSRRDALIEVEGLVPENTISDSPRRPERRDGGISAAETTARAPATGLSPIPIRSPINKKAGTGCPGSSPGAAFCTLWGFFPGQRAVVCKARSPIGTAVDGPGYRCFTKR